MGGEPTVHPQIKEICIFLRELLPDINISLFTNGLILDNLFANNYQFFNKYKIEISMTLYPLKKCLETVQNLEKQSVINQFSFHIHGIRPYFSKTSVNYTGENNIYQRFFTCCSYDEPFTLLLYQSRLYHCNVLFHFKCLGIPEDPKDSINLLNILNKNQLQQQIIELCKKPNNGCKYCGKLEYFSSDGIMFWNVQKNIPSEYNSTLLDLYLDNYPLYYQYAHQSLSYDINILKNKNFIKWAKRQEFPSEPLDIFLNRFITGKGDICIFFNQLNSNQLKKIKILLDKQNNNNFLNFYLINTDGNKETKKDIYKFFAPYSTPGQNYFFLENLDNKGIITFYINSYISQKYILDITDSEIITELEKNKNFLISKLNEGYNNERI